MKFMIVSRELHTDLEDVVNEMLDKGWELHGSPYYSDGFHNQAMTGTERKYWEERA